MFRSAQIGKIEDYEKKFLKRNVEGKLKRGLWNPWNWLKYSSPYYGRSEYAAEYCRNKDDVSKKSVLGAEW